MIFRKSVISLSVFLVGASSFAFGAENLPPENLPKEYCSVLTKSKLEPTIRKAFREDTAAAYLDLASYIWDIDRSDLPKNLDEKIDDIGIKIVDMSKETRFMPARLVNEFTRAAADLTDKEAPDDSKFNEFFEIIHFRTADALDALDAMGALDPDARANYHKNIDVSNTGLLYSYGYYLLKITNSDASLESIDKLLPADQTGSKDKRVQRLFSTFGTKVPQQLVIGLSKIEEFDNCSFEPIHEIIEREQRYLARAENMAIEALQDFFDGVVRAQLTNVLYQRKLQKEIDAKVADYKEQLEKELLNANSDVNLLQKTNPKSDSQTTSASEGRI